MDLMFYKATSFSQSLCWDTSGKNANYMFYGSPGTLANSCGSDTLFSETGCQKPTCVTCGAGSHTSGGAWGG